MWTRPILVVIDGGRSLAAAVRVGFDHPLIQRCQIHKVRNVEGYLPKDVAKTVTTKMRVAYRRSDPLAAEAELEALARGLEKAHPGAAGSLREGLTDTFTVGRLGVAPTLGRSLRSTNPTESMIGIGRDHSSNVKRWRDGTMALRWCAAGTTEAAKQFRRVQGHLDSIHSARRARHALRDRHTHTRE